MRECRLIWCGLRCRQLHSIYEKALWRIMSTLETNRCCSLLIQILMSSKFVQLRAALARRVARRDSRIDAAAAACKQLSHGQDTWRCGQQRPQLGRVNVMQSVDIPTSNVALLISHCSHEVGGQLGWVNAERNGVVAAIHKFTYFTTGHAYYGSGVTADNDTEDARDGRFTCQVCGRST